MPFSEIIGHEREIKIFKRALKNDRVAHSFIFCGPEGIGKRFTALAFAKALNCKEVVDDFCGHCQSCRRIDNGADPNVVIIEPREPDSKGGGVDLLTGTIKIGHIRDVQQRLSYRVEEWRKKVCVVNGAEKMNREASNAFLKTLEEPPIDTIIILIASQSSELLPTILSRCQRINFSPIKREVVTDLIRERLDISEERALLISGLSGGSLNKAISMWDDELLEGRKVLLERLNNLSSEDINGIFELAGWIAQTDNITDTMDFLKIWYRDIAVFKEGSGDMVINRDMVDRLERAAQEIEFDRLWNCFRAIHQAERDMLPPRYANKQLTIEVLLMDLTKTSEL
jgi:DNA polymerase-3 subunit delta'